MWRKKLLAIDQVFYIKKVSSPSIILSKSPVELIVACRLETVLNCAGITTSHIGFLPIVIVPSRELCSAIGLPVMGSKNLSSMKNSIGLSKRTS